MSSLNVPVPGEVKRLANDIGPRLTAFDVIRERHSIVLKRLDDSDPDVIKTRIRRELRGAPAVEARISGIDVFPDPPTAPAPVLYLTVESPGLQDLHRQLVAALGAVDGFEGEAYVPHVTLARGGALDDARRLAALPVEPITWTVSELEFFSGRHGERTGTIALPA